MSTDTTAFFPRTAGREAPEDRGPAVVEDKSVSELSDNYPAGPSSSSTSTGHPSSSSTSTGHTDDDSTKVTLDTKFDVRVTEAERSAMNRRARSLGVKRSRWARETLLDALDQRRDGVDSLELASVSAQPVDGALIEQLRRVGVNLNQSLRRGAAVDDVLLRQVMGAVDGVRAQLGDRTVL